MPRPGGMFVRSCHSLRRVYTSWGTLGCYWGGGGGGGGGGHGGAKGVLGGGGWVDSVRAMALSVNINDPNKTKLGLSVGADNRPALFHCRLQALGKSGEGH